MCIYICIHTYTYTYIYMYTYIDAHIAWGLHFRSFPLKEGPPTIGRKQAETARRRGRASFEFSRAMEACRGPGVAGMCFYIIVILVIFIIILIVIITSITIVIVIIISITIVVITIIVIVTSLVLRLFYFHCRAIRRPMGRCRVVLHPTKSQRTKRRNLCQELPSTDQTCGVRAPLTRGRALGFLFSSFLTSVVVGLSCCSQNGGNSKETGI